MRRPVRIALIAVGSLAALAVLLSIAALIVVRTSWFHDLVRRKIVESIEKATGGTSEIGSYEFDWKGLTAHVDNFVLRGSEPSGSPPLFQARTITLGLKVISVFEKRVDLLALDVQQPQIDLIIHADGSTNIPAPKPRQPRRDALQTILDLAVKRITLENGLLVVNSGQKRPFDLRGENLRATLGYQAAGPRYQGDLSIDPLYVSIANLRRVPVSVSTKLNIEKDQVRFEQASLALAKSRIELTGTLTGLAHPELQFHSNARLDLAEVSRLLDLKLNAQGSVQIVGDGAYPDAAKFTGALHASGVGIEAGALNVRGANAESAVALDAARLRLTDLRLSAVVNPPSAPQREMIRVEGRIRAAGLEFESEALDLDGISLATLGGSFAGTAGFQKFERFHAAGTANGFDAQTLLRIYTSQTVPWDGLISGPVHVEGSLRKSGGIAAGVRATISAAPTGAPVHGLVEASYDSRTGILDLGNSSLALPSTSVQFSGALGRQLQVRLDSKNLDEILPAAGISTTGPNAVPIRLQNGELIFTGDVSGKLDDPQIAGHLAASNLVYAGRAFDALAADVTASPSGAQIRNASVAKGSLRAAFTGSVGLADWKTSDNSAISGSATVRNAAVADLLAFAGQKSIPVTGTLNADAQFSGSIADPLATADVHIAKGQIEDEPLDRLDAKVTWRSRQVEVSGVQLTAGGKQVHASATYQHAPGDLQSGRVQFQISTNALSLDQVHTIAKDRPGVKGTLEFKADGALTVSTTAGKLEARIADLRAEATARGLKMNEQMFGDAHLAANTEGQALVAHLESNFAGSTIRGDGRWRLTNDYPGNAQIQFSALDFGRLRDWLAPAEDSGLQQITGSAQGSATIEGPAFKFEEWRATLEIPQFQLSPAPKTLNVANPETLTLRNSGPIQATLQKSSLRITSARLVSSTTNLTVAGTISLKQRSLLDLQVAGAVDVALLKDFDPDVSSSGQVVADVQVRGTLERKQVSGKLEVKGVNLNYAGIPNGLSNANGVVVFSGTRASIQSFTGETGGGKVTLSGFAGSEAGEIVFRIGITAREVRMRYPEGVSTVADADLTLQGSSMGSVLSGQVTILRTGFNPRTDLASILAKSSEPVRTASAQTGLLSGMRLDVQISMSPDVTFQSSLAENIQAEANLRLQGTALNPGLQGRITITQGQLVFFGTKFTMDQGSISFFNPVKIEPVLNVDLETKARGVDVILTVSGPLNKLNVTPRSDPPLQFSEIIALLATGNAPSTEPAVVAQQPSASPQTWQQIGASALLGQALANPVSGRLQRFFGVTKLRIDPSVTGVENNPQARITIEQQVTPDITFTYITNVTNSNPQVVRVEWALNKTWSVVALREENGMIGLDFLYKKRFR